MECQTYPNVKRNLYFNLHNTHSQALKIILMLGIDRAGQAKAHGFHVSAKLCSVPTAYQWLRVCFNPSSMVRVQQVL